MEIFVGVFAVLLVLVVWAAWFDRRQRRRGAPVGDVARGRARARSQEEGRGLRPPDDGGWGGVGL